MSRDFGWKEFEPDSPESAESPTDSPIAADPAPLPWAPEPVTGERAPSGAPESTSVGADAAEANSDSQGLKPAPSPRAAGAGGFRLGELIWFCLAVVDLFLALDFGLRAIAAGDSSFVRVVINVGNWLAGPFVGVLSHRSVPTVAHTGFWAALVAIVIYTLAAWLLIRLLRLITTPASPHAPRRRA